MNPRTVVYALAGLWAALIVTSVTLSLGAAADGDGFTRGLSRIASFLTWQGAALVVAAASAAVTRLAAERGVERIKLAGYLLAASVFIVGALVVMIAFRVLVQPAFA